MKSLAPRQEIRLAARVRKGDIAAREELLKGCLPLVVTVAQGYSNRGLTLLDLVSEGNLGLIQAVQHFDPAKSDKLSTFSSGWIKRSIESALDTVPRTSRIAA